MTAYLKSVTNNRVTKSLSYMALNFYKDPSAQLKNMFKYTSIFNKAILQPAGLVGLSLAFLYIAKKVDTKKQKAAAIVAAIATGIIGAFPIYTLFTAPTNMENRFV